MSTLRETVGQLSRAQKPSAGTPAYSRFVNRRIGRVFAAAAFLGHRTPNQVSLASGFCSLVGIVLIALVRPSLPLALAVTALLVLGYGLDSADGQLARLRGGGSPLGEWLDHMIDSIKIVLLHSAVLISFYRFDAFSNELVLLVPLAYVCMSSVLFFGLILIDQLRRRHGGDRRSPTQRGDSVLPSRCSSHRPTTASCAWSSWPSARRRCSSSCTALCSRPTCCSSRPRSPSGTGRWPRSSRG